MVCETFHVDLSLVTDMAFCMLNTVSITAAASFE